MAAVVLRICAPSFSDVRGIRHTVEVEAKSLYEAVVLGVRRFRQDPWIQQVGEATVLEIEVREPATRHSLTLAHVERLDRSNFSNAAGSEQES
jgi:hypothetical protein